MVKISDRPVIGGMTDLARRCRLNMATVLTRCYHAVMAGFTVIDYARMVEVGDIPSIDDMTGIAFRVGLQMVGMLTCGLNAVMTA